MSLQSVGKQVQAGISGFGRSERGSLTIFSLFVIVIMLVAGGLAVDFMRQETTRVRLQSTLDRAILAAADLDQDLSPQAVVDDYFAKAGLSGATVNVTVSEGLASRKVSAVTTATLDTYFMNFIGINEMVAPAAGSAEESISNIEISLVLDVSTSMLSNSKIDNLKIAGEEFIDTIFASTEPGKTTISIVPYATQVNAGANILDQLTLSAEHDYSNCLDFTDADYQGTALDNGAGYRQTGHFDPTSTTWDDSADSFVCRTDAAMEILPVSGDAEDLKDKIDALVANGWTSIDVGVKWGAALLDPANGAIIDGLVATGDVDADNGNRPYAWEEDTLKVLVVMTDGINTKQWYLNPDRAEGLSNVWWHAASGKFSIQGLESDSAAPDPDAQGDETFFIPTATGADKWQYQPHGNTESVQLTWPEVWAKIGVRYHAWNHVYGMTGNYDDYLAWTEGSLDPETGEVTGGTYGLVEGEAKDDRLDLICSAAKEQGIVIYSVGFEVTDHSATVMEACATTPSHFFRVEDQEIVDAFQAIANDIGKLRLTQ